MNRGVDMVVVVVVVVGGGGGMGVGGGGESAADQDVTKPPNSLSFPIYRNDIKSFRIDMPGQTMQTQIRLLLEEQSDQGLHCLQLPMHLLDALL